MNLLTNLALNFQQTDGLAGPSVSFPILFITLVLSAFILLRRYRSRKRLVERIAELETLSDAGRAIVVAQIDVNALSALIAKEASSIIDTSTFQIGLFEDSIYKILFWTVDGEPKMTPRVFDQGKNSGLIGWVRKSRRSLLIGDFQKEMTDLPAQPSYLSDNPPRSAVFIPLIRGKETIGVMAAQSTRPNAFSQRDLGLLTVLANQSAAAIANAQIYEQERTKAAHLELVGQIARQISATNDLDELLNQVVTLTQETFDFGSVNVFTVDPATADAIIQASTMDDLNAGALRLESGSGLVGTAVANRITTLSNNTENDMRFFSDALSAGTRSEIAIPLIVDQELLGVLDVQSPDAGAFAQQEQSVLESLAAQVAVAIHKAQQLAHQRRQRWMATAQLQVARAITQSDTLDTLAESLVRLTALLVGVEQCAILIWDAEIELYVGLAAFGLGGLESQRFQESQIEIGQWKALDAVHVGGDMLKTNQLTPWNLSPDSTLNSPIIQESTLLLPLIAKGRILGAMIVGSFDDALDSISGSRIDLLLSISNQASQAIDGMQLQIAQQEEAWVNTALLQVAEAVNKLTDLNEILYTIVRMVPMLVGVRSCIILIRDEEHETYQAGPSHGLTEMGQGLLESFEVDLSEFPLLGTQDVERIGPDAAYYTFRLPKWMDRVMSSDTADLFPLHARGQLVGALVVGPTTNGRPLTGRRLNIVTGIAQQAAIAVVNDQLYKESAERNRMEQELNVARSIQASLIPDGAPDIPHCSVASFWAAARQVSGDFYDFMSLPDGRWGIAIADVADKGVPAALFMALSRTILRTVAFNRREPAEVLERTNQLIYGDTSSDHFVTVFYAVWDPESSSLTFASGGHNPPILLRKNGDVSMLSSEGIALGVLEEITISQQKIRLNTGDIVIFYTDGVTEAMNEDYDEFGTERLCLLARNSRKSKPEEIIKTITQSIDDHAGGTPQFDDITLVVMKR